MQNLPLDKVELRELVSREVVQYCFPRLVPFFFYVSSLFFIIWKNRVTIKRQIRQFGRYNLWWLMAELLSKLVVGLQLLMGVGAVLSWILPPDVFPRSYVDMLLQPIYALLLDTLTRGLGTDVISILISGGGGGISILPLIVNYGLNKCNNRLRTWQSRQTVFRAGGEVVREDAVAEAAEEIHLRPINQRVRTVETKQVDGALKEKEVDTHAHVSRDGNERKQCEFCTLMNNISATTCLACERPLRSSGQFYSYDFE
jgi:hypothetical protein